MPSFRVLLLTDIVDSTSLASALGEVGTRELWAAHDQATRALEAEWHAEEIEKTDGVLLLFESVAHAVGFAAGYHRALAAIQPPLRARVGVHIAQVEVRENAAADVARGAAPREVVGVAKPIVARVMSAALGGQTLMTADARLALGVTTWRVLSHGHWRLKGVPEAFELFEVGDRSSPFAPPPDTEKVYRVIRQGELWQPLRSVAHNLPAERDPFVGRRDALQALADKIERGSRLVSVLGTGGTGKTRLVVRYAWTWLGDYPGGVWFCDLSAAITRDGIYFEVAQALDVPLGKTDPAVQLAHAIAGRGRCLVIFDNVEQVARYAEETIGKWLDRATQATFVVTTREVLDIPGEDTLAIGPMNAEDGRALFVRRVQAAGHASGTSAEDVLVVDQLVKVLDGLPLAIELAAARIRVMSPQSLLARMRERFKLLGPASGRRDRQATLRATFDWSWELLTVFEKIALAQLSVFEGGFTLASAEAVVDFSDPPEPPWMVDVVQGLVDKSFVRALPGDRFDLLESVRQYAAEHLSTQGRLPANSAVMAQSAVARHYRYFAGFNEAQAVANDGVDLNNVVAACRRACEAGDAKAATGALVASWAGLQLRGPFQVAMQLVRDVEPLSALAAMHQAWVDWIAASALDSLGQRKAASERTATGLQHARAIGDRGLEGRFLCRMGAQLTAGDGDAAMTMLEHARAIALEIEDLQLQGLALAGMGSVLLEIGRPHQSRTRYEEAMAVAKQTGDVRQEAGLLGNIGTLLLGQGDLDGAQEIMERCLSMLRAVGDRRWEGNMHCNLGMVHLERQRPGPAIAELEQALGIARSMGHARLECTVLCNLGIAAEMDGDVEKATRSYEEAVRLAAELADRRSEGQFRGYLGLLLARSGHIDAGLACLNTGERLLLAASDEWNLGLLLCRLAEAEHRSGRLNDAMHALGRVEAIVKSANASPSSELGKALAELGQMLAGGRGRLSEGMPNSEGR
jgi:predicted ATPase/class 3 adenylate cyclase/Tfp pilus assembly protein PilF